MKILTILFTGMTLISCAECYRVWKLSGLRLMTNGTVIYNNLGINTDGGRFQDLCGRRLKW